MFFIFSNLHKITFVISIVGFLISVSSSIVISSAVDFSHSLGNQYIHSFIIIRIISEGIGYISKFFSGFFSDLFHNRKLFLSIGYGAPIIAKIMFIISTLGSLDNAHRAMFFNIGNMSDKIFNCFRDAPRDALIADYTDADTLKNNLVFRKILSVAGTITGSLITIFFRKKVSYSYLYAIALCFAISGAIILYLYIEDKDKDIKTEPKNQFLEIKKSFISIFQNKEQKRFLILFIICICFMFLGKINETYLWARIKNMDNSISNAVCFLSFYIASIFGSFFLGFFKRICSLNFLILAAILNIIFNIFLFFHMSVFSLFLCNINYGFTYVILETNITVILLSNFSDKNIYASLISLTNLIIGFILAFSSILMNFINKNHNIGSSSFLYSTVLISISLFFLIYFKYKKISRNIK
jgi:Na+/melibiose symporter-like transporter